jgi:hypothetical protein
MFIAPQHQAVSHVRNPKADKMKRIVATSRGRQDESASSLSVERGFLLQAIQLQAIHDYAGNGIAWHRQQIFSHRFMDATSTS